MKKLALSIVLLLVPLAALCDGTGTQISWPGWTLTSTEELFLGHKHTSFPLTYLFDNNPATTWVFSGTGKHAEDHEGGYALTLSRDDEKKGVMMDSVWIMNGYNRSPELFLRNNRILQLKLYINQRYIKPVALSDSMGWHRISFPRQRVTELKLRFTKFDKGRDNDVCVSEIACYDQGDKVDLKMPKAVLFTKGDGDCGCGQEYGIIDVKGKWLGSYDMQTFDDPWSPSGRYIAGLDDYVSIIDTSTGKVVVNAPISLGKSSYVDEVDWDGDAKLEVCICTTLPKLDKNGEHEVSSITKTFLTPHHGSL